MSFLDIATALAGNSLTLFIGTGFSKYLTDGNAPSWLELLIECTKKVSVDDKLFNDLFEQDKEGKILNKLDLTIIAQILELEFLKQRKEIRETVSQILSEKINDATINEKKVLDLLDFFAKYPGINIITTNYDNLLSKCVIQEHSRIVIEGSSIGLSNLGQNIYHVHGSILKPNTLVLTLNDYFKFQHKENFFSRKIYTLLQETTVVVLGYSLVDFDLNRILNESKNTDNGSINSNNIYYVSRKKVDSIFKKYYLYTYGINVIEDYEVDEFFDELDSLFEKAKDIIIDQAPNLKEVLNGKKHYKDKFIKLRDFLKRIMLRAVALGIENDNIDFHRLLLKLLKKKKDFTRDNGAWDQYTHLAEWLIDVSAVINLKNSPIMDDYLEIVKYSFRTMSKEQFLGYSWAAFGIWESRWDDLRDENQELILELMRDTSEYLNINGVNALLKRYEKDKGI